MIGYSGDRARDLKPKANPQFERIRRSIAENAELLQPWSGFCYRVTSLEYPGPRAILSGEGSFRNGGRWNAIGSFRTVYGSTEDTVAVQQSRATAEYYKLPYPFVRPRLLVAIEFRLARVLNFSRVEVRVQLGINEQLLAGEAVCKPRELERLEKSASLEQYLHAKNLQKCLQKFAPVP